MTKISLITLHITHQHHCHRNCQHHNAKNSSSCSVIIIFVVVVIISVDVCSSCWTNKDNDFLKKTNKQSNTDTNKKNFLYLVVLYLWWCVFALNDNKFKEKKYISRNFFGLVFKIVIFVYFSRSQKVCKFLLFSKIAPNFFVMFTIWFFQEKS